MMKIEFVDAQEMAKNHPDTFHAPTRELSEQVYHLQCSDCGNIKEKRIKYGNIEND